MKIFKRVLASLLCAVIIFSLVPHGVFVRLDFMGLFDFTAKAATYTGACGDNLTWIFDDVNGDLAISGTGNMTDWASASSVPWFTGYHSLIKSVTIEKGVESIGKYAFFFCENITSVTIPDSVTSIGYNAFAYSSSISDVYYSGTKEQWSGINIDSRNEDLTDATIHFSYQVHEHSYKAVVTAPTCVEGGYTTHTCWCGESYISDETPVTGHTEGDWETVTASTTTEEGIKVKKCVFCGKTLKTEIIPLKPTAEGICGSSLKWEIVGKELKIFGTGYMYDYSTNSSGIINSPWYSYRKTIQKVTIEEGVQGIGDSAFSGFIYITEIVIPESVEVIGAKAFWGCTELSEISILGTVYRIGAFAFVNTAYFNNDSNWSGKALYIGRYLVDSKEQAYVTIKDGTILIADESCKYSRVYSIPDSVEIIGSYAFMQYSMYDDTEKKYYFGSDLTLPKNLKVICNNAFEYQQFVENLYLNKGIEQIHTGAFRGCEGLTDVYYPGSPKEWSNITITSSGNKYLLESDIHYYYDENIESVSILSLPDKMEYFQGESFDVTGLKMKVAYTDGTVKVIANDLEGCCSDWILNDEGDSALLYVDVAGYSFPITVKIKKIESVKIEIMNLPDKLEYELGETIDLTGLKLKIINNNGTEETLTSGFISGVECDTTQLTKIGTQTVQISYMGMRATFDVTVVLGDNHEHSYNLWLLNESSCTEYGLIQYECICGDIFYEKLDKLPHKEKAPVYSGNGIFVWYCENCDLPARSAKVSLKINHSSFELLNKSSSVLTVTKSTEIDGAITWETSDASVISVDENGKITAESIGVAEITATLEGTNVCASALITVTPRKFYVTWIVDDDIKSVQIPEESSIEVIEPPQKEGYVFVGWTPSIPDKMPAKNVTFIAVFEEESESSTIELNFKNDKVYVEENYILGLPYGIGKSELTNYIDVSGNGELCCDSDFVGTGTQIIITDKNSGETVFVYELVFIGDVSGDGIVGSADLTGLVAHNNGAIEMAENSAMWRAADLNDDNIINSTDISTIKAVLNGAKSLD